VNVPGAAPSPEAQAADPRGWLRRHGPTLAAPVLLVVLLSYWFHLDGDFWWRAGVVALGLGLVIFIHELGHFLVAKWCDVHVETFSIGFGPPLPGCCFKRGETTYMIALFPLGGYVKMVGEGAENDESDTDPRSFKNKPVWQRMAIISAGVTMNLLLAFACFVFVFRTHGDEQAPGVVNVVDAGSPAWKAGIHTGDVLYRVGDLGPDPTFKRLTRAVRKGKPLRFVFGPPGAPESELTRTEIVPRREEGELKPAIGILAPPQLRLWPAEMAKHYALPARYHTAAAQAEPPFEFDDEIIATTDPDQPGRVKPLPPDPRNPEHRDYFEFQRRMMRLAGEAVTVQVRRHGTGEVVDVHVPGAFHRTLQGVRMRMGQITAVRDGSPAAAAGIQPGDIIEQVEVREGDKHVVYGNAKAPEGVTRKDLDPTRLPFELREWARRDTGGAAEREVTLTLLRKNQPPEHAEQQSVRRTMAWDFRWWDNEELPWGPHSPQSVPGLGLAYRVETTVEHVTPESSAYDAGLRTGDVVKAVRFYTAGKQPDEPPRPQKWQDLKPDQWAHLFFLLQNLESQQFDVRVDRDNKELALRAEKDEGWPLADRGLLLVEDTRLRQARSLGEALAMGLGETRDFAEEIYENLEGLLTRRISPKMFGGPIMIAYAGYQLSGDVYRFIMFLGIIGVNLAVVNFLPIPVLDGGHMVLLVYEKLRGKPAPELVRVGATMVGVALILLLMGYVIYLDAGRFIF
jgi:regulator of sigma E protease